MEVESEAVRTSTLEWWDTAVPSRLNDPKTGAFVVIMQRLHQSDLSGHILKNQLPGEWTHLCVPSEYEKGHPHIYTTTLPAATYKEDPRSEEGALLWPERFPLKAIDRLKRSLGEYGSAGQLQQRPAPKGGGIIKQKWWRKWEADAIPEFIYVLQSWDTAFSEKETNSYSACTTWGVFNFGSRYHIMIIHRFRSHMPYTELRKRARELYNEYNPDAVLIEKKASGQSLIQDLKMSGIPVLAYTPDRDKVARAHAASALLETGLVWYPDRRWADEVIHHCAVFPAGDGTDIVDTVTQALIRLRQMWFAVPHDDDTDLDDIPFRDDPLADNVIQMPGTRKAIYG
jgi:predicted phage terminase large subunit-like protein